MEEKRMDYRKAYALLMTTISAAIDQINKSPHSSPELTQAIGLLQAGLDQAEEMYLSAAD